MRIRRSFPCLPVLSTATLLQSLVPILIHPTSESFAQPVPSRRRRLFRIPLFSSGGNDIAGDDHGTKVGPSRQGGGGGSAFEPFERIVRTVTGNDEYAFGDIAKSVVGATAQGVEGTVRSVTRNKDYQFGDLTRKVVGATTHGVDDIVKSATGKEGYQFGDLTRGTLNAAENVITYSEKSIRTIRDNNVHELVGLLDMYWTKNMGDKERTEAFTMVVYLGAMMILAYNFIANLMSGMVFGAAWTRIGLATGKTPLHPGYWSKFLEAKSTMDILFGGPCLPARALIAIPWFFQYRKFVICVARISPLREKFPILNRYVALILSWVLANLAFVGGITLIIMKTGSLISGVPIFSVV